MRDRGCNQHPPVVGSSSPPDETAPPQHGSLLGPLAAIRYCCESQRVASHSRLRHSRTLVSSFRQVRSTKFSCCRLNLPPAAYPLVPAIVTCPWWTVRC